MRRLQVLQGTAENSTPPLYGYRELVKNLVSRCAKTVNGNKGRLFADPFVIGGDVSIAWDIRSPNPSKCVVAL